MVRLDDLHPEEAEGMRRAVERFQFPELSSTPWVTPPPLAESTIALVTSAGLHRRGDRPFRFGDAGYRMIPDDIDFAELVQTQVSVNFDRTHYQQDVNVVLPRDLGCTSWRQRARSGASRRGTIRCSDRAPTRSTWRRRRATWRSGMRDSGVDSAMLSPV